MILSTYANGAPVGICDECGKTVDFVLILGEQKREHYTYRGAFSICMGCLGDAERLATAGVMRIRADQIYRKPRSL